ncbi:aspartyl protease family protein At5g10770-like [Carex rostrata]
MATCLLPLLLFLSFSISAFGLQNFHVVDIHSLMSSDVCSSSKDSKSRLRVVDRYGPCSTLSSRQNISPEQILSNDQSRVNYIQSRVAALSGQANNSDPLASSKIPAQYGGSYGVGNYIVQVGFGTPSKTLTLVFDTGSEVTWIQCEPCQYCYMQLDPIFDPSQSTTFANVSCNSIPCNAVSFGCSNSSCLYGVLYGDGSYTIGYYAEDTLTLNPDVIEKFRFGCGQDNEGLFGEIAGLLALGPANDSFVLQTSDKYHRIFSYCLPGVSSSTGYLKFGTDSYLPNTKRTPIPANLRSGQYYYFLNMTGLSVAGESLKIQSKVFPKAGTIIDSGTVITRLPPDAYKALRSTFRKHMKQYKMAPSFSLFDTCYDFTGLDIITIPSVGIQFLNDVSLDLDPNGILYAIGNSQACLAFASNRKRTDLGIFGNVQQRTFNVMYDVWNGEIGFSPDAC